MLVIARTVTFEVDGVVFDKDGTLISLESYWLEPSRIWIAEAAGGSSGLARTLDEALGFETGPGRLVPDGPLATAALDDLVELTRSVLVSQGIALPAADRAAHDARDRRWH